MSNVAEIIFAKEREFVEQFADVDGMSDIDVDKLFDFYSGKILNDKSPPLVLATNGGH